MRKSFCFFIFLICSNLFSQQKAIDSLEALLLNTNKQQNTLRLNVLLELGYAYYLKNPDRGLNLLEEAITIAKNLKNELKLARAYQYKAHNYSSKGNDSMALVMYDSAIGFYNKTHDTIRKAIVLYNKGLIYFNQSDYKRANKNNIEAYSVFKEAKDSLLMAKLLNSISLNHMYLSDYTNSLSNFFEALTIYEKLNDTTSLEYAHVNGNMGLLYSRIENYPKSIEYHQKAFKIYEKSKYQYGLANSLTNIGNAYDYLEEPQKAIAHYDKAYKIMQDINYQPGVASALTNMGIAYITLKEYNKALTYFNKSKPLYESLKNSNNLAIVHDNMGVCYLELENNIITAKKNFEMALMYAKESKSLNLQANALENLTKTNYKLGNYKTAYHLKEQAVILKDSFYSVEKKEEIARLEEKYKYENEKSLLHGNFQIERLQAKEAIEKEKFIKSLLVFGGGSLFLLVVAGMFFYRKKSEADFKAKVSATELKVLQAQMNPHFIFNSLNSINSYIIKNDLESATNYLTKFSRLIRKTLESSTEKEVLLKNDIEVLKHYLDIEKKRLENSFTYTIKVDEAIDANITWIPPLILQPFLENSIWHGIAPMVNPGHIAIEFKKENNMLFCSVDDNGIGRKQAGQEGKQNKSIGINLTKSRIHIINAQNKNKGSLNIIDKEQGVRVEVTLPLKLAF